MGLYIQNNDTYRGPKLSPADPPSPRAHPGGVLRGAETIDTGTDAGRKTSGELSQIHPKVWYVWLIPIESLGLVDEIL